jgi:MATE family multidrug resistance protein
MNKEILRLAIPNIISNISIPLLSTVDTALMGRMSPDHLGAVGLGSMIFNFIYWNFGFLRMGTTGIAAQAFGRQDSRRIIHTLIRSASIALLLALILLVFQLFIGRISFFLMNVESSQQDFVAEYFYIRIWAAPATLLLYALLGWFFGMQNAIYPLIITITVNLINIGGNFYFIYVHDMEVDGVAWATVLAQYVGLLLAVALFFYRYSDFIPKIEKNLIYRWEQTKQFLLINRDIFIRTIFLTIGFAFFYSQSSQFGPEILAVNVVLQQLVSWISYGIDGFAFATESLVGKYKGAGDIKKLGLSIKLNFLWSLALVFLYVVVFYVYEEKIIRLFTDIDEVIQISHRYYKWVLLFPVAGFACYIWDGVFVGLTASKAMRNSMAVALVFYIGSYYLLEMYYGNDGLWMSLLIFLAARGLAQTQMFYAQKLMTA